MSKIKIAHLSYSLQNSAKKMVNLFLNRFVYSSLNIMQFTSQDVALHAILFPLCLCALAVGAIPLVWDWRLYYGNPNYNESDLVMAMNTDEYRYSLVACIAVSIPIFLDYVADFISCFSSGWTSDFLARGILLFALLVPDFIMLTWAVPARHPSLMIYLFQARNMLGFYATVLLLNSVGRSIFNPKSIAIFAIFALAWDVMAVYLPYMNAQYSIGYWMFIMIFLFAGTIYAGLICKWMISINIIKFELTPDDYSCGVYIVTSCSYVTGILILHAIFGRDSEGNSSPDLITSYTYFVVAFTISISFFQGRLIRKRVIRAQQVIK